MAQTLERTGRDNYKMHPNLFTQTLQVERANDEFLMHFQSFTGLWNLKYGNHCPRFLVGRLDREKWPLERITVGHPVNFEYLAVCTEVVFQIWI